MIPIRFQKAAARCPQNDSGFRPFTREIKIRPPGASLHYCVKGAEPKTLAIEEYWVHYCGCPDALTLKVECNAIVKNLFEASSGMMP